MQLNPAHDRNWTGRQIWSCFSRLHDHMELLAGLADVHSILCFKSSIRSNPNNAPFGQTSMFLRALKDLCQTEVNRRTSCSGLGSCTLASGFNPLGPCACQELALCHYMLTIDYSCKVDTRSFHSFCILCFVMAWRLRLLQGQALRLLVRGASSSARRVDQLPIPEVMKLSHPNLI